MKRSMMQAYVQGSVQAAALYREAFGAELGYHVVNEDGSFYHAELTVFGQVVSLTEARCAGNCEAPVTGNTMQFCFHMEEGQEGLIAKAYEALKEGGAVYFPIGPTDFSPCAFDVTDKFGVRWCMFL